MKKIRRIGSKTYIMLPIIFIFLAFSCSCRKETVLTQKNIESGEELFKGILFGEGVVGEKLSDYTMNIQSLGRTQEEKNIILELENEIINSIKERHPDYFNNFQIKITSGNISEIEKELASASKFVCDAIEFDQSKIDIKKYNSLKKKLNSEIKHYNPRNYAKYKDIIKYIFNDQSKIAKIDAPSLNVNVTYQTNTAIYLYIAAVVAAAMVIVIVIGKDSGNTLGEETDPLFKEQFISKVAETFKLENPN